MLDIMFNIKKLFLFKVMLRLHLIEAYALPLLTYACHVRLLICLLCKFKAYQYAGIMRIGAFLKCISGN